MSLLHTSQPDGNATRQKQGNDSLSPPKCDSKFHTDVIAKLSLFLCVKSQALEERKCFFQITLSILIIETYSTG